MTVIEILENIKLCAKKVQACIRILSTKCVYKSYIYIYIKKKTGFSIK